MFWLFLQLCIYPSSKPILLDYIVLLQLYPCFPYFLPFASGLLSLGTGYRALYLFIYLFDDEGIHVSVVLT